MALTAFASLVLLLAAAGDVAPPGGAVAPPGDVAAPPAGPLSAPSASELAVSSASDAASALRATQDLEAKLIEIRRELEGLEKQHAAWADVRLGLDTLTARVDELARQLDDLPRDGAFGTPSGRSSSLPSPFGAARRARAEGGWSSLRWSARLQAGYEGALVVRGPGQTVEHADDRSGFLLRHAELMVEGQVLYRRFEYRLLVDFAEPVVLKDAFLQWRATPWLGVRVGRFKLPFGFQRYLRSTYYDFVDASEAMNAFSLERDVGAMVVARPLAGRLQFQLAVTNGALANENNGAFAYAVGQSAYQANRFNDNLDLAYTARVVAAPWGPLPDSEGDLIGQRAPRVSFGVAGHFNLLPTDLPLRTNNPAANVDVDRDGRVDNVAVWQGAAELRAHFHGAAVQAELFRRLEHPGAAAGDRYSGGQYAQASYMVLPHVLQVAARIERTDLPLYGAPFAVRQSRGTRIDAQTGAVSAFFHGHDLKVQVDYSHLAAARVAAPAGSYTQDSHRLRVSAQLIF